MHDHAASSRRMALRATAVVLVAFVLSLILRWEVFLEQTGAQGLEATYHLLWTGLTLTQSDPSAHFYLPTVTLAPEPGNAITWGSAVPTPDGAYIYNSFPPLGFLLPAFVLEALDAQGDFFVLSLLNSAVGLVAAFAVAGLVRATLLSTGGVSETQDGHRRDGWHIFTASALVYLLSREALVSHGAVSWPHSLSQLCLIAGCWLALRVFTCKCGTMTILGLALVAVLYPSLEWTGFVFASGLFATLLYHALHRDGGRPAFAAAIAVAFGTLAAGGMIIAHFSIAIGPENQFSTLSARAGVRDFDNVAPELLPKGWLLSFGLLLPAAIVALVRLLRPPAGSVPAGAFWLLLIVASVPMLENLIMMQHAVEFSFDRLKLAVPLLLVCGMALWTMRRPVVLVVSVGAVVLSNLALFVRNLDHYDPWGEIAQANARVAAKFAESRIPPCATVGTSINVRGYLNLSLMRDIHETIEVAQLLDTMARENGCAAVFVHAERSPFPDLPVLIGFDLYGPEGALLMRHGES